MVESSIPDEAAVVAAPMQKLCPAYLLAGRLAFNKASLTWFTNLGFERGVLLCHRKRGPGEVPRWDK